MNKKRSKSPLLLYTQWSRLVAAGGTTGWFAPPIMFPITYAHSAIANASYIAGYGFDSESSTPFNIQIGNTSVTSAVHWVAVGY